MVTARLFRRSVLVSAALAVSPSVLCAAPEQTSPAGEPATRIAVSFKMDPRVLGGSYGGERWIAGQRFSSAVQQGTEVTIEAKVRGRDAGGKTVPIDPAWVAEDADMVAVSPVAGTELDHVQLTVKKLGECTLRVGSPEAWKELRVTAKAVGTNAMVVTITQ